MVFAMFVLCVLLALAMFFRTTHLGYLDGKFPDQENYHTIFLWSLGLGVSFATNAPIFLIVPSLNWESYNLLVLVNLLGLMVVSGLFWGVVLIGFGERARERGKKDRPVQRQTI